ncbi:MFS transporter [Stackebrandtia soli]|uniref:MFS transporter n=1 Tax=Stackebrandtia soli TaxID=1892856 RepID=UPI0039E9B6E1
MTSPRGHATRRHTAVLSAATLTAGTAEVVDFLLPLFAGLGFGATPTQIGLLLAVEMAFSLVARPLAGILADHRERGLIASVGALTYGIACVGYAVAGSMPLALAAAALSGLGGAALWVALRAMAAERLTDDSAALAGLSAAESAGGWLVFIPAMVLIGVIDYRGVFAALAACCLAAAIMLAIVPRSAPPVDVPGAGGMRLLRRRLSPMLWAVVCTMAAEAAIGLLLLLHLQRGFELEPVQIAYVFLPGAIAMSVLPTRLHGLVVRFGRRRMLAASSVASAVFAGSLAFAPNPIIIAALWILAGVAWAVVIPVQQAVVAEAVGPAQLGRGLGLYESACLVGALLGTLGAGALFDAASWWWACLAAAVVILAGAVIVPAAVRALGVVDHPAPATDTGAGEARLAPTTRASRADESVDVASPAAGTGRNGNATTPAKPTGAALGRPRSHGNGLGPSSTVDPAGPTAPVPPSKSPGRMLIDLAMHIALFGLAFGVVVGVVAPGSTPTILGVGSGSDPLALLRSAFDDGDVAPIAVATARVWFIVVLVDTVWTLWKVIAACGRRRPE